MTVAAELDFAQLRIAAIGTPVPQGSKVWRPNHRVVDVNHVTLGAWRDTVATSARRVMHDGPGFDKGVALSMSVTFLLRRPKSHYRTGRNSALLRVGAPHCPTGTPDLDKLVRAVCDALTDAGAYHDDAQVVDVIARKRYAAAGSAVGAVIVLTTGLLAAPTSLRTDLMG